MALIAVTRNTLAAAKTERFTHARNSACVARRHVAKRWREALGAAGIVRWEVGSKAKALVGSKAAPKAWELWFELAQTWAASGSKHSPTPRTEFGNWFRKVMEVI